VAGEVDPSVDTIVLRRAFSASWDAACGPGCGCPEVHRLAQIQGIDEGCWGGIIPGEGRIFVESG
jgi:hypothetical protein